MFHITPELVTRSYRNKSDLKYVIPLLKGELPSRKNITSDAEKALIKLMNPRYNTIKYKDYPKGKDGLFSDDYDHILYTISDEIILNYSNSKIRGGSDRNLIIVKNQNELFLK